MNTIRSVRASWVGILVSGVGVYYGGRAYARWSQEQINEETSTYQAKMDGFVAEKEEGLVTIPTGAEYDAARDAGLKTDPAKVNNLAVAGGVFLTALSGAYLMARGRGALPNQMMHMRIFMQAGTVGGLGLLGLSDYQRKSADAAKLAKA